MKIMAILAFLEKIPRIYISFFALLLILTIGCLDFTITGYDVPLSSLYLLPVILIAWCEGGLPATVISIFSALTWGIADLVSGHVYSQSNIAVRNALMMLALFLIVSYFIVFIKIVLRRERRS
jgi:hypothetical protein